MKIELTLTQNEARKVERNARRFGYDIPRYVRFVISQETRQMTPRMIRRVQRAIQADRAGKTRTIRSFTELLP